MVGLGIVMQAQAFRLGGDIFKDRLVGLCHDLRCIVLRCKLCGMNLVYLIKLSDCKVMDTCASEIDLM